MTYPDPLISNRINEDAEGDSRTRWRQRNKAPYTAVAVLAILAGVLFAAIAVF